jgi:hypothetical protein
MDLAALAAQELEASRLEGLQAHLSQCGDCRGSLEAMEGHRADLADLEDPPGFEQALSQMHDQVMARVAAPARAHPWRRPLLWAAAAGLLLATGWRFRPVHREMATPMPVQIAQAQPVIPASIPPVPIPSSRRRHRPAAAYDPVRVARRILESSSGTQTVLIQQSPQVVIYWVKPIKEASHES